MMSLWNTWVMQRGGSLLDGVLQDRISGEVGWQQKSYPLGGGGTHALVWVYSKDSGGESGSDRGWVDYLQWTPSGGGGGGSSTTDWEQITYTYDPSGRRIAKDVDGVATRYVYDGDECIAEYDGNDVLLRKYIHGPCIDQPICMIEAAGGYAGTFYYHFDALGSVVALSDADGDTAQVYEYDVYGQVAASDANHPNRFLFTGREFDKETGLYYYRARYYNPAIGRFLQTDPIGYGDGMNWYAYCANNAITRKDPSGLVPIYDPSTGSWTRGSELYPPISSPSPGSGFLGPYFWQGEHNRNCMAAAVLNVAVTLGTVPIDRISDGVSFADCTTDAEAVDWTAQQLQQAPGVGDSKIWGYNLSQAAVVLPNSGVKENATQTFGLGGIADQVDAGNCVIIGVDQAGGIGTPQWHALAVVPTPPTLRDALKKEYHIDYPYMIADGMATSGHGLWVTEKGLITYLSSFGRVHDDWLVAGQPPAAKES